MADLTGPLGALTEALDALCAEDPARLCDREAIKALHRQLARLEAATTRASAAFDAGRDWEDDKARSSASWIAMACHLPTSAARRRVRLGRDLRLMDVVEKAWLAGDIGEAQVGLLARARVGPGVCAADLWRTPAQRRADALVEMAKRSGAVPEGARMPEPLFSVLIDYETLSGRICELANGEVVTPGSLLRYLDATRI